MLVAVGDVVGVDPARKNSAWVNLGLSVGPVELLPVAESSSSHVLSTGVSVFAADCRSWKEQEKRSISFTSEWVVVLGGGATWGGAAGAATTVSGVGSARGGRQSRSTAERRSR